MTEIEEIYGNVGKKDAMQRAYGVNFDRLYHHFSRLNITHVYADDSLATCLPELHLLRRRLAESYGQDVRVENFSAFPADRKGAVWRFRRSKDFAQYPPELRRRLLNAQCTYVNPLFQGYGTKAVLALPCHPELEEEFRRQLGPQTFAVIQDGFTRSRPIEAQPPPGLVEELVASHKACVRKVVDCPGGLDFTWGSRGVFFRDRSATRFRTHGLAALALPSQKFGANAAWVRLNVILYDLLAALKRLALPADLGTARPRRLRFLLFDTIGRVVRHARGTLLRLSPALAKQLFHSARIKFHALPPPLPAE